MRAFLQNTLTRRALGGCLALGALGGLTGCTDEEVAASIGLIAIGAGAVIIGGSGSDDNDHHDDRYDRDRRDDRNYGRCEGGWVERCTTYSDYNGRSYRECRSEYDSCYRFHPNSNLNLNSIGGVSTLAKSKLKEVPVQAGLWAKNFKMSFAAADFFTNTLVKAREGDASALSKFGFTREDVKAITQNKMPSDQALDILAKRLNQNVSNTKAMFRALIQEGSKLQKR
jgi:hypothetical protein